MKDSGKLYLKTPIGNLEIVLEENNIILISLVKDIGESDSLKLADQIKDEFNRYFEGNLKQFTLPYKLAVSPFRKTVLEKTSEIAFGKTSSYLALSVKAFNQNKARAVGQALNKNPLMILIPCHRVIGNNQQLIGYNGGIEVKSYLINLEKRHS
jgi:methylated-DNA-[protein]-cysteine S-methyltransferase